MKKYIYTFLMWLLVTSFGFACSCIDFVYFCESVTEEAHVVRGEILNKYEIEGVDEFDIKYYMDVLVVENILGELSVDTVSVLNAGTSCDLSHEGFAIGDEVILNIDENSIDAFSGHPYVSPGGCATGLLMLNEDGIVEGGIRSDLNAQSFEVFKSEIGVCSELTALDRWIEQLDKRLHVFPNPSSENVFVWISFPIEESGTYELYDALGKLLQQEAVNLGNRFKVKIQDYPIGVYFLKLKIRDQVLTRKVVRE